MLTEVHFIKNITQTGMEGCCYHVTEGVSHSPSPVSLSLILCCPLYHTGIVLASTKLWYNLNELASVEINGKLLLHWY